MQENHFSRNFLRQQPSAFILKKQSKRKICFLKPIRLTLGAFILLAITSCGQTSSVSTAAPLAEYTAVKGQIDEIVLDGTSKRCPVSVILSAGSNSAAFQVTDQTLFLDEETGLRLPPSDLLEARAAHIYAKNDSQPPCAEAILLHIAEDAPSPHLHTVEETSITETGLLITTDNGSLHLFIPENATLTFYADGVSAAPESLRPGDRVFAWYDSIKETYPAQASSERLVIVPALPDLPETLPDGISFSVLPGSVTPNGASFRLFHNTNAALQFGSDFALQKCKDGEWHDLPYTIENGAFTMEAYYLPKGEPRTLEIRWDWLYGELLPGEYRLVKTITDFRHTGDFDNYTLPAVFTIGEPVICGKPSAIS